MEKFYESGNGKDSIETTDHETCRLTTTSLLDYIKETIKPTAMNVYQRYFNLTDHNCNCCNTHWKNAVDANNSIKNALDCEYSRLLQGCVHFNINNPSIFPNLKTKHDGCLKIRLYYPVNDIHHISLLERDNCNNWNCNNEGCCINSADLVPTCKSSLLTYFFEDDDDDDNDDDDDDEDNNTPFSLLTFSNIILDCNYTCKLCYTIKMK